MKEKTYITEDLLLSNGFSKNINLYTRNSLCIDLIKGYQWVLSHKLIKREIKVTSIEEINEIEKQILEGKIK